MNDQRKIRASAEPSAGNGRSIVIRGVFALLALGDLALMYWVIQSDRPLANRDVALLGFVGAFVACVAMILRWQRFDVLATRLHDPGPNLGVLAKLLGWFAAGLLPATLYAGSLGWAILLFVFVLMSIGLWMRYGLVVWLWYLVPLLFFGYVAQSVVVALYVLLGPNPMTSYDQGRVTGTLVLAPLWFFVAWKLYSELRAWHRRLSAPAAAA